MRLFFLLLIACTSMQAHGFESDSTRKEKWVPDSTHTPLKAGLFSAVLPGAGQIYNRRHWKAPIVWGALGTTTYFSIHNQNNYKKWNSAYLDRVDDPLVHTNTDFAYYSEADLQSISDTYRKRRNWSYISTAVVYSLQIAEASADAYQLGLKEKWVPDSTHTPRKAAIFSAVLPGAGQIYNRRFWKAPIVWGALGTTTYFIIDNQQNYTKWRSAYLDRLKDPTVHNGTDFEIYTDAGLRTISDAYRRRRDLSYIATTVVYTIQIVEASVDAHFLHFDDSDDLSFDVSPTLFQNTASNFIPSPGLRLTLKF